MKKIFCFICYVLLPTAAAFGMKIFLDKRKSSTSHGSARVYLRPVKWKLVIE